MFTYVILKILMTNQSTNHRRPCQSCTCPLYFHVSRERLYWYIPAQLYISVPKPSSPEKRRVLSKRFWLVSSAAEDHLLFGIAVNSNYFPNFGEFIVYGASFSVMSCILPNFIFSLVCFCVI